MMHQVSYPWDVNICGLSTIVMSDCCNPERGHLPVEGAGQLLSEERQHSRACVFTATGFFCLGFGAAAKGWMHHRQLSPNSSKQRHELPTKALAPVKGMKALSKESLRGCAPRHPAFVAYIVASLVVCSILLIDPLFNQPSGLITSSLFTGVPSDHGSATPCNYDYEGSWQIGLASGASPLDLKLSNSSVLTCAALTNFTAASYVAEPFLLVPPGEGGQPATRWFAFYQVKSLARGKGEIGVAHSMDFGRTWQHLGTALTEEFSLSSPWVTYDSDSSQYIMIPDTHKSRAHTIQLYATSKQDLPFGWRPIKAVPTGRPLMDTNAIHYQGRWWIFATERLSRWGQEKSYSLHLFHTANLTGDWVEHVESPISGDLRYARGGGRPFVYDGHVYRWAQDDSNYFGQSLHLFKISALNNSTYLEEYTQTLQPSGNGNWYSARTHYIDVQQIGPGGTWFGLADGDSHKDGHHHFHMTEAKFVRCKNLILRLTFLQLVLVLAIYTIWNFSDALLQWASRLPCLRPSAKGKQPALVQFWVTTTSVASRILPEVQLLSFFILALVSTTLIFVSLPQFFWCPRWAVHVNVHPSPPVTHHDPSAPFPLPDLVVVSGATASFFDRLSNMVGSVHTWEPGQRIAVYDLGFSQSQLAKMMCWENVEVRRFPYEKYPEHVRDVRNYAFKTLVLQEALVNSSAVLWIDSGLELRAPMTAMRREMAQHGHVSAMQEDAIGDPMYTYTRQMSEFFGMGDRWDEVKHWEFCAGGLQGFVRGSDAERLVLQPVVNCSLHKEECIAPEGSSRKNHNFDQTALTLMIWANNFSCLPRETHCMWSVKKAARDPLQRSDPIEVVSRGHRQPKPYSHYIRTRPGCVPNKADVPWPALGLEHQESLSRYSLAFRISRIYMQPVGDALVQVLSCPGSHILLLLLFWVQLAAVAAGAWCAGLRKLWALSPSRRALHLIGGLVGGLALQVLLFHIASNVR